MLITDGDITYLLKAAAIFAAAGKEGKNMLLKTFMKVCNNSKLTLSIWNGGSFIKIFHIDYWENPERFKTTIQLCENFRVDTVTAKNHSMLIELDTAR